MTITDEIDYSTRINKGNYPSIKRIMFYYLFDTPDRIVFYYPELDEMTSVNTIMDSKVRKFDPKHIDLLDEFLGWFHENPKPLPPIQLSYWGDVFGGKINWSEEFWKWLRNKKGMINKDIFINWP